MMIVPLLSLLLSAAYYTDVVHKTSKFINKDFITTLNPDLLDRTVFDLLNAYSRPTSDIFPSPDKGISKVNIDENSFEVILDVQLFKPEEINVKIVDKYVVVSGKHEEKEDVDGLISRQFTRRYVIPESIDPDTIKSEISSDGVLTVKASVNEVPENKNERKVNIEFTGKPALKPKREEMSEKKYDFESNTENPTTTQEYTTEYD